MLWDRTAARIAGAYRMGLAPEILATHGPKGLTTGTLFRYSRAFYKRLDHAIELGRSFIRQEYQRHPAALRITSGKASPPGFGATLPYRILFGPVSISADYDEVSSPHGGLPHFPAAPSGLALSGPTPAARSGAGRPALRQELRRTPLSDVDDLSSLIATIGPIRKVCQCSSSSISG
ncbi:MAG: GNAT family N-acetyltransferase [Verrucomicrobiales bacterium]